ncbi:MAG: hypothetical protein QOD86_2916 [Miltoncostaeaceae bacterium]|jgi:hypothetical protein|nr:hypothetical protein [Miltoncostaeaceae bacterium]
MSYVIVHTFPGGTEEQYQAALAAVHPGLDQLPPGQLLHYAGPSAAGWTIVAVHDSKESWETFRDETLLPVFESGIEGSFAGPPDEIAFQPATELSA